MTTEKHVPKSEKREYEATRGEISRLAYTATSKLSEKAASIAADYDHLEHLEGASAIHDRSLSIKFESLATDLRSKATIKEISDKASESLKQILTEYETNGKF